jgi:acetyltransferase-like isoleucine patch superfamily enzyme
MKVIVFSMIPNKLIFVGSVKFWGIKMFNLMNKDICKSNQINAAESASINHCSLDVLTFFNGSGGINNKIIIKDKARLNHVKIIIRGENNIVEFDEMCSFIGTIHITGSGRKVRLGERTHVNGAEITCRDQDIYIGKDALLSNKIVIRSSDSHKIFDRESGSRLNVSSKPVNISDNVWIGQSVFIGKNVTIPKGCVVAAGAIITRSLKEENAVIGGVGGEILRSNIRWEK